jgi:hypothetical protein
VRGKKRERDAIDRLGFGHKRRGWGGGGGVNSLSLQLCVLVPGVINNTPGDFLFVLWENKEALIYHGQVGYATVVFSLTQHSGGGCGWAGGGGLPIRRINTC